MRRFIVTAAMALALASSLRPALAQGMGNPDNAVTAGTLTITQPWSRATPGGAKVAAGYVRIANKGREPDRLIGATSPLAGRIEIHETSEEGGVARMRPVDKGGVEIKPGATVEFKPGGYHLMLLDLKEPLKEGQTVKGTLVFEKDGAVPVEYAVRALGAQTGAMPAHAH